MSARQCVSCGSIIQPTGKRGRPRHRCERCAATARLPEFYKEPCHRCNQPIPHTHKRGRPPLFHRECFDAIVARNTPSTPF